MERAAFLEAVAAQQAALRAKSPADQTWQGRSASPLRHSGPLSAGSPVKEDKPSPNQKVLGRPSVGFLSLRKVIMKNGTPSPSRNRVVTVATRAKSPSYSPNSPAKSPSYHPISPQHYHLGSGIGKVLQPPPKAIPMESVDSSSTGVCRHRSPPPIHVPLGVMEWTDDSEANEDTDEVKALRKQIAALQIRLNNMDERVAESEITRLDTEDDMETLRKTMTAKFKHLAKAPGHPELYRRPDPRD